MAYRMAPMLVTLNDLEGHAPVVSAIRRTFVQYFTRFQLTAHSRGPSATAGLFVTLAVDISVVKMSIILQ